jgi:hypothetical protein
MNYEEEKKKGEVETVNKLVPNDMLDPLRKFQELFNEQLKL